MPINFTVRPLVEYVDRYFPDLSNILDRGCYGSLLSYGSISISAGSILGALNSDTSEAIKSLTYSVPGEHYLEDSSGYIKIPKPSAVVVCLRSDVDIVVSEIFSIVKPVSAVMFPSVESLVDYYGVLDRDMLTQKRIAHLVANKNDVHDTFVIKAMSNSHKITKPKALTKALDSSLKAENLKGQATVAIVLNAPLLVGGHYKVYEKLWLNNQSDKVGNEPDFYEADSLIGELYQSCTKAESIQEEGCVKCTSSSTCAQTLLSNQNMPNVINAGFVWVEAKSLKTPAGFRANSALLDAENINCLEVTNKLKESPLLNYIKPYLAKSEEAEARSKGRISQIRTRELDMRQSNIDSRAEYRKELRDMVSQATIKRKDHCSKCSMLDGCRPRGNKDWATKFYSKEICKGSIPKYEPKEPILDKVYKDILKNKRLYKAICLYSGSQIYYTRNASRLIRYYKGSSASIGHITSLEAMRSLDIPYIYFGKGSSIQLSNNRSTVRAYSFEGYELSSGSYITLDTLMQQNKQGIQVSLYKAIVRTGLLRMYEIPYEVDKDLEGWVARLIIQDDDYSGHYLRGRASIVVYVPLQIALLGLGTLNPLPGSDSELTIKEDQTPGVDRTAVRDYRDHMKLFRDPVVDKKALAMYVKAYDIVEYPLWSGGGFSAKKCRVHSNVSCSLKPGTGMLHITQYSWRIRSSDDISASTGVGLEVNMPSVISTFVGTSKDSAVPFQVASEPSKSIHWYYTRRGGALVACMGGVLTFRSSRNRSYVYVRTLIGESKYSYKKVRMVDLLKIRFVGNSVEEHKVHSLAEALIGHYGVEIINRFLSVNYLRDKDNPSRISDFTSAHMGKTISDKKVLSILNRTTEQALLEVVQILSTYFSIRGIEIISKGKEASIDSQKQKNLIDKLLSNRGIDERGLNAASAISATANESKPDTSGNGRQRVLKLSVLSAKDFALYDASEVLYYSLMHSTPMALEQKLGGMNILSSVNKSSEDCYTGSDESLNTMKIISKAVSKYKLDSLSQGFSIRNNSYPEILTSTIDNVRRLINANHAK